MNSCLLMLYASSLPSFTPLGLWKFVRLVKMCRLENEPQLVSDLENYFHRMILVETLVLFLKDLFWIRFLGYLKNCVLIQLFPNLVALYYHLAHLLDLLLLLLFVIFKLVFHFSKMTQIYNFELKLKYCVFLQL